jgi:hypothetical protein
MGLGHKAGMAFGLSLSEQGHDISARGERGEDAMLAQFLFKPFNPVVEFL